MKSAGIIIVILFQVTQACLLPLKAVWRIHTQGDSEWRYYIIYHRIRSVYVEHYYTVAFINCVILKYFYAQYEDFYSVIHSVIQANPSSLFKQNLL